MTHAELLALAERVEAATGPDRALEEEIDLIALDLGWRAERKEVPFDAPRYTSSIDAAVSLVPDGWAWQVNSHGTALCWPNTLDGPKRAVKGFSLHDDGTPANALAAAALRARAEEVGDG